MTAEEFYACREHSPRALARELALYDWQAITRLSQDCAAHLARRGGIAVLAADLRRLWRAQGLISAEQAGEVLS